MFNVDVLCIVPECRGSGLAREMVECLKLLMPAIRATAALTVATSVRTRRLMKDGYSAEAESDFKAYVEYLRSTGKCTPLETDDDPKTIQLMAKRVDKC